MSFLSYEKFIERVRRTYYLIFPRRSLRNLAIKAYLAIKFISLASFALLITGLGVVFIYVMIIHKPVNFRAYSNKEIASNEYLEIQKMKDILILVDNKSCDAYRIVLRNSKILYEQSFDLQKYTRTNIESKTKDGKVIDQVCKNLERLNNGIPLHILLADEKNEYIQALSAIGAVLYEASSKSSELHLFVKGYADKSKGNWTRKLEEKYLYKEIKYYTSLSTDKNLYYISEKTLVTHFVPYDPDIRNGYYSNEDLPFLRANYVLENHIKNNLSYCFPKIQTTGILEGEILDQEKPELRNTEVYVTACY